MKLLLHTLFLFLLVTQICFAQWVQLGLDDKGIKDIAAKNSNIFAITSDSGIVYRSIDNGTNWTMVVDSTAIDIAIAPTGKVFMVQDSVLNNPGWYPSALFSSSDNGDTWMRSNIIEQLIDSIPDGWPTGIMVSPEGIVCCGLEYYGPMSRFDALAKSTDDGLIWTTPGKGVIGGDLFDFRGQSVITFGYGQYAMNTFGYFHLSSDNGQTWLELGNQFTNPGANVLSTCSNGSVLIGSWDWWGNPGLFLSTDLCSSWTQVSLLTPKAGLSIETGVILIGTDSLGVFLFSDNGDSLCSFNQGLTNLKTHTLSMDNNGYVYLGTDNGVWRRPLSEIVPVELASFTATANGKEVILNWSTATELNNQGFEIERSGDNISFNKIGFVPGFGTTTEPKSYSYTDQSVNSGTNYYRLKQVDYDRSYEYSDVVEVEWRAFNSYLLEQNFPNPFNPTTTIGFGLQNKSNVKITILNSIGEEVAVVLNEEKEPGFHQVEFNAINSPSGVYFYQLKAGEYTSVKKMILLK